MITTAHDPSHLPRLVESADGHAPDAPMNVADTGIERGILLDLVLKSANTVTQVTTEWVAQHLHLSRTVADELLEQLRNDFLVEVLGKEFSFGYRYSVSQRGRERAAHCMEISGYIGPAPVTLEAYGAMLKWQIDHLPQTSSKDVEKATRELMLSPDVLQIAGLAVSSGRSLFLSGPPGNGKTSLGRSLHQALSGSLWIPHCIAVDGAIIRLFDAHCHHIAPHAPGRTHSFDRRWVKIHRPFIVAGGEMTLASLDLAYHASSRYYEAPLHMKANGGTFLIDDFGRQRVAPDELLNRWIIPLEHQIDFLTLHTGQKIPAPFLLMLIIATNLDPKQVTDPAFLRRLGYRAYLNAPSEELYIKIFENYAAGAGLSIPPGLLQHLLNRYNAQHRELRACEPRDLIERALDICRHRNQQPQLRDTLIDLAWTAYFGQSAPRN